MVNIIDHDPGFVGGVNPHDIDIPSQHFGGTEDPLGESWQRVHGDDFCIPGGFVGQEQEDSPDQGVMRKALRMARHILGR